jgi:molecular chaperone DnaK
LIDLRNQGEALAYSTKKSLEEHGGKISQESRGKVESALSNLEDKLKGEDKASIQAAMKNLNDAAMELGKAVYEASSAGQKPGEGADAGKPAGGKEDVIDAEFEVNDQK